MTEVALYRHPKLNMKLCGVVNVSKWENIASDRTLWRAVCKKTTTIFEDQRVDSLKRKYRREKPLSRRKRPTYVIYVVDRVGLGLVYTGIDKVMIEISRSDYSFHNNVCICVCMYVRTYVCMYVYMYVWQRTKIQLPLSPGSVSSVQAAS